MQCLLTIVKISQTIYEKGHPRNISMKLFQNLTIGFREEDFFKNLFMSLSWKQPPFTRAMFNDGLKFRWQFLRKVTQKTFL